MKDMHTFKIVGFRSPKIPNCSPRRYRLYVADTSMGVNRVLLNYQAGFGETARSVEMMVSLK